MADQLLIVEDDLPSAALYEQALKADFAAIATADTVKNARAQLEDGSVDLLILDVKLPDGNGLDLLRELHEAGRGVPTVVLTGLGSVRVAVEAMHLGASDFLVKPCSPKKLRDSCLSAVARWQPSRTADSPAPAGGTAGDEGDRRGPSGFLGESAAMKNVFALIEAAGQSSASVFITGESGTGKELCATAIHNSSERRNGPFVALNCAAIPRDLMESEIFGHRRGAFTGAIADHEGAAEAANGGTLFLDEICEMDLDLQAKLLRFIQMGTYKRIGDAKERSTDIRFVCATNKDPLEAVRQGRFREDLYYRLHVIPIEMPPLRERAGDILLLAERFLHDFSRIEGRRFTGFEPAVERIVENYAWPGNVRQLENVVRNVVVLNDADAVAPSMLPTLPEAGLTGATTAGPGNAPSAPAVGAAIQPKPASAASAGEGARDLLVRPLAELEMMAIEAAIEKFDGNVTKAARALDISTSTIYRKQIAWEKRSGG